MTKQNPLGSLGGVNEEITSVPLRPGVLFFSLKCSTGGLLSRCLCCRFVLVLWQLSCLSDYALVRKIIQRLCVSVCSHYGRRSRGPFYQLTRGTENSPQRSLQR